MGQQISLTDLKTPDLFETNSQHLDKVLSTNETEDIHSFLPFDIINEINRDCFSFHNQKNSSEL